MINNASSLKNTDTDDSDSQSTRGKENNSRRRSRRPLVGRREVVMVGVLHVTNALRPVRRRCRHANARPPPSTSTESVSCHTEENLGVDQWYNSMSRSPPAAAGHTRV
jgi:hypothetical protein